MSIYFTISSIFFIAVLIIYTFLREEETSIQTKTYKQMLIITLIGLVIDVWRTYLFKTNFDITSTYYSVLTKGLLIYYIVWFIYFAFYSFSRLQTGSKDEIKSKNEIFGATSIILALIFGALILTSPITFDNTLNFIKPLGYGVSLTYIIIIITYIVNLIVMFMNKEKATFKNSVPLLVLSLVLISTFINFYTNKDTAFLNFGISLIMLILSFYLENPEALKYKKVLEDKEKAETENQINAEFLNVLSHEIRTPLNSVQGFSEEILKSKTLEEAKANAENVISASHTLLDVTDRYLNKTTNKNKTKRIEQSKTIELNLQGKTILVVDDNNLNLKIAEKKLLEYKAYIDSARSGKEAFEKVKENAYDLIFMDDMMPYMSGTDAMNMIKNSGVKTPIIALTANASPQMREKYLDEGFDEYISKPINNDELVKVIKKFFKA